MPFYAFMSTAKGGFFDANLYNLKKEIKIWKLTEDINSFQIIISKKVINNLHNFINTF